MNAFINIWLLNTACSKIFTTRPFVSKIFASPTLCVYPVPLGRPDDHPWDTNNNPCNNLIVGHCLGSGSALHCSHGKDVLIMLLALTANVLCIFYFFITIAPFIIMQRRRNTSTSGGCQKLFRTSDLIEAIAPLK